MFTCGTIVGIPPDNLTISIFSGSLKRWQEKPGSVFATLDGVRENKHSLTCSTITVKDVRKHQLQPMTPPTCNIAALAKWCKKKSQQLRLNVYLSAGWVRLARRHQVFTLFCSEWECAAVELWYDLDWVAAIIFACAYALWQRCKRGTALRERDFVFIEVMWGWNNQMFSC